MEKNSRTKTRITILVTARCLELEGGAGRAWKGPPERTNGLRSQSSPEGSVPIRAGPTTPPFLGGTHWGQQSGVCATSCRPLGPHGVTGRTRQRCHCCRKQRVDEAGRWRQKSYSQRPPHVHTSPHTHRRTRTHMLALSRAQTLCHMVPCCPLGRAPASRAWLPPHPTAAAALPEEFLSRKDN